MSQPPAAMPILAVPPSRPWLFRLSVALLLIATVSNLFYLWHNCPLDFSEDESHYWEWARHLDYGYYSKPPGIAWLLAGTLRAGEWLHLTGDGSGRALMPLLRTPAVIFAFCSGLLSLLLARRISGDDRAALAVTLLSGAAPLFAVGSLLITIDSPMYLSWAATVYCLWRSVEAAAEGRRGFIGWLYLGGVACGVGMLFKPVLTAIPLICVVAIFLHPVFCKVFASRHAVGGLVIVLLSQVPVVIWNARHDWLMFKHIGSQGGLMPNSAGTGNWWAPLSRFASYVGGQAGGMGGMLFVLLVCGVITAWRLNRVTQATRGNAGWRFLLLFSLPLWVFYALLSFWKATEPNWPAASYLRGWCCSGWSWPRRWPTHRGWRRWTVVTIAWGLLLTITAMNLQRFYPLAAAHLDRLKGTAAYEKSIWNPGRWDPAAKKLRGFAERADAVDVIRRQFAAETGQEPFIVSGRYDLSSSLAFYMSGHPFVYSIMSSVGGRQNQYDLWPGLNETDAAGDVVLAGKPALLVGNFDPVPFETILRPAFERIDPPVTLPISVNGIVIRYVTVYKAYGFKRLPPPPASSVY